MHKGSSNSRALLGRIPELEIATVAEGDICCCSAGVYNLLHSQPTNALGDRKVKNLLATEVQAVVSANSGCLLQLMNGLRRQGMHAMPTFHMVELMDASMRGLSSEQLLQEQDGHR
jgi:glycolate oxidase iron-sulfur subunit